jgi:hypothetical protein
MQFLPLPVMDDGTSPEGGDELLGGRNHAQSRQIGAIIEKGWSGKEGTPAMSVPLELRSAEEHGSHLQNEADREEGLILFPHEIPVKGLMTHVVRKEDFPRPP